MPHIVALSVGSDPLVLGTRNQVLRSDGHTVVSAISADDALKVFLAGDFDLVILCHSIPERDRESLTNAIHNRSPKTPVVLVAQRVGEQDRFADATIENDPARLLEQLPKLLRPSAEKYPLERRGV